jgi:hypothetical protein
MAKKKITLETVAEQMQKGFAHLGGKIDSSISAWN